MRTPGAAPMDRYVYRRVPRSQWHSSGSRDEPSPAAFVDRHQRLSVYLASVQTPRSVLQMAIDAQIAKGPDGERFLALNGRTVEELVLGPRSWRVVRIPLAAFLSAGLTYDRVETDGHIELCGDPTLHLDRIAQQAEVLSAEECLRHP